MKSANMWPAVIFFAMTGQAYGFCQIGDTQNCIVNGKPGIQVCDPNKHQMTLCQALQQTQYGTRSYAPAYYILSLLYAPPGNASTVSFGQTNTEGTTTGVSSAFGTGMSFSVSATGGFFAQTTLGVKFSESGSEQHSSSFQVSSSSAQGAQLSSKNDAIAHSQDRFFLWLNPLVTVTQTGPHTAVYTVGTLNGDPVDVIDVSLDEVKNPNLIPAAKMGQQIVHGISLPGLSKLKPSDFPAIASMDTVTSLVAAPTDTTRFVYVKSLPLEGPDTAGSDAVKSQFGVSDGTVTTTGTTDTRNITTSLTMGDKIDIPGVFTVNVSIDSSLTWTYGTSSSQSTGGSDQANLTFGTSHVGCLEWVDVYSDLMFHTMMFVTARPTCAPIRGVSEVSPVLSGTLKNSAGKPIPHEAIVMTLPNGTIRRIYTDNNGRYMLYSSPAGTLKISAAGLTSQVKVVTGKPAVKLLEAK
jgi:hypothetical protein